MDYIEDSYYSATPFFIAGLVAIVVIIYKDCWLTGRESDTWSPESVEVVLSFHELTRSRPIQSLLFIFARSITLR